MSGGMRPKGTAVELERRRRAMGLLESGRSLATVARMVGAAFTAAWRWRETVRRHGAGTRGPDEGREARCDSAGGRLRSVASRLVRPEILFRVEHTAADGTLVLALRLTPAVRLLGLRSPLAVAGLRHRVSQYRGLRTSQSPNVR